MRRCLRVLRRTGGESREGLNERLSLFFVPRRNPKFPLFLPGNVRLGGRLLGF